jgi:hypothetical protein
MLDMMRSVCTVELLQVLQRTGYSDSVTSLAIMVGHVMKIFCLRLVFETHLALDRFI